MSPARPSIDEFIAFMAAEGAANLVAGRRGAEAAAIARYVERVSFPLPPLYVEYLREFGDHADGVVLGGDGSAQLEDLLSYYDSSADEVPAGCAVICTPAIDAAVVLHREGAGAEPTIRRAWSGAPGPVQAPSFAHHLHRSGWRCAHGPNRDELTTRLGLAELARYLLAIGCERLWFSGGVAQCFAGDGAAIDVAQAGDVTRIAVMGRLAAARERYARAIVRKTGARWLTAAK